MYARGSNCRWGTVLGIAQSSATRGVDRGGGRVGRRSFGGYVTRMSRVDAASEPLSLNAPEARIAVLEARLKEAIAEISDLRARDALKTQFLANISHDLRTPLTAVITHAEILRDGILGDLSPRQLESVRGIISGGRQLLNQVGEILTYARGAANQLTIVPTRFAIRDVLEQVSTLNESLLKKKLLSLSVETEPGLPRMSADREKIAHGVGNLLGNAIEFTPSGGRVWVRASRRQADGGPPSLMVEVGDTGLGIAPEHHDLIF